MRVGTAAVSMAVDNVVSHRILAPINMPEPPDLLIYMLATHHLANVPIQSYKPNIVASCVEMWRSGLSSQ